MLVALLVTTILAASPHTAKTTPPAGDTPVRLTATGTFADGSDRVFHVTADRDSDNDGVADLYDLRVTCSRGAVSSAVISSRYSLSGHGSGGSRPPERRAGGISAMDDWTVRSVGKPVAASWDLAKGTKARMAAGPKPITLVEVDPVVCSS